MYPGSFDPMTNGHVDLIRRGCRIFDRVLVAVLLNTEKSPLFTVEERISMIESVFRRQPKVRVKAFQGLLVNFLREERATVVVRAGCECGGHHGGAVHAPGPTPFLPASESAVRTPRIPTWSEPRVAAVV